MPKGPFLNQSRTPRFARRASSRAWVWSGSGETAGSHRGGTPSSGCRISRDRPYRRGRAPWSPSPGPRSTTSPSRAWRRAGGLACSGTTATPWQQAAAGRGQRPRRKRAYVSLDGGGEGGAPNRRPRHRLVPNRSRGPARDFARASSSSGSYGPGHHRAVPFVIASAPYRASIRSEGGPPSQPVGTLKTVQLWRASRANW
jgi:hypothetical protein